MKRTKETEHYVQDLKNWQEKQYVPGAFTGHDKPFPITVLGKKKWFQRLSMLYLLLFFAFFMFGLVQMVLYIMKHQ